MDFVFCVFDSMACLGCDLESAYFSHGSRCLKIFRLRSCSCLCSSSSSCSHSYLCSCSCSQPEEIIALMQARFFLS